MGEFLSRAPREPEAQRAQTKQVFEAIQGLYPQTEHRLITYDSATLAKGFRERAYTGDRYPYANRIGELMQTRDDDRMHVYFPENEGRQPDQLWLENHPKGWFQTKGKLKVKFDPRTFEMGDVVLGDDVLVDSSKRGPSFASDQRFLLSLVKVIGDDLKEGRNRWFQSLSEQRTKFSQQLDEEHSRAAEVVDELVEAINKVSDVDSTVYGRLSDREEHTIELLTTSAVSHEAAREIELAFSAPRDYKAADTNFNTTLRERVGINNIIFNFPILYEAPGGVLIMTFNDFRVRTQSIYPAMTYQPQAHIVDHEVHRTNQTRLEERDFKKFLAGNDDHFFYPVALHRQVTLIGGKNSHFNTSLVEEVERSKAQVA